MELIHKYLKTMQNVQYAILEFLENEENSEENYQNIIKLFDEENFLKNQHETKAILIILSKISNNHNRTPNFFPKILQIIKYFKNAIHDFFSNFEIFKIFRENKAILLFLFKNNILQFDQKIADKMMTNKYKRYKYPQFFFIEIKPFLKEQQIQIISKEIPADFEEKRQTGENDEYICNLIRNDLIEEFIIYVNKTLYSLSSNVNASIFETNLMMLKKATTLIEYAAFFGSVQIFKYLLINGKNQTNQLWFYAIHSQNEELIHLLEENKIEPKYKAYEECLEVAVECHHNDIVNYLFNNYLQNEGSYNKEQLAYCCFEYYNFAFIQLKNINEKTIYDLCFYSYYTLVDLFLRNDDIDINECIVFANFFLFSFFH